MMGKWTMSHNASPPHQYGVAARERPGASKAGEKIRQPVWGQVWLAEPSSHRGARLEVFGFLDSPTPHLWVSGARVSQGPSVDPPCPCSLQSSRVLGGPIPYQVYFREVPKAFRVGRVVWVRWGRWGERIGKGSCGSSGEEEEEPSQEGASRAHANAAMR